MNIEDDALVLNNRIEVINLEDFPNETKVKVGNKVYSHIIRDNLDFWTDNPQGDGQESATEVFTKGDRTSLPLITHDILVLTKELGNDSAYTKGVKSKINSSFYQWYYINNPKVSSFIDKDETWETVGNLGFSTGTVEYIKTVIDNNNTPYVVYKDNANSGKITVQRYNKDTSSWEIVGKVGLSSDEINYLSISIDSNNIPYITYPDKTNIGKVIVKKYNKDTKSWEIVGKSGFSKGYASYTSIAINSNNTPYVVYRDTANSNKAIVQKYNKDKNLWKVVGKEGFSQGIIDYTEIVIDNNDVPYVVYKDRIDSNKVTVQKYNKDTDSWEVVGNSGFSQGSVKYTKIVTDTNNIPYVVYIDNENSNKVTVQKYNKDTNSWELVGDAGFSQNQVYDVSISIDMHNILYVSYYDSKLNTVILQRYNKNTNSWETIGNTSVKLGASGEVSISIDSNNTPYLAYKSSINSNKISVVKMPLLDKGVIDLKSSKSIKDIYETQEEKSVYNNNLYIKTNVNNEICYKDIDNRYYNLENSSVFLNGTLPVNITCTTMKIEDDALVLNNRQEVTNWENVRTKTKVKDKVYTHIVRDEIDFWTDNPQGDGQESATEIFTKGDRRSLPTITHDILVLTKELENDSVYIEDVKSQIDNNFYRWFYTDNYKVSSFVDKDQDWEFLENPRFSQGKSIYATMVVDSNNTPYVVYKDKTNSDKIIVQKHDKDTNSWEILGNIGSSSESFSKEVITIDNNDIPYISYQDKANLDKITVKKYNKNLKSWEILGNLGFSQGKAYHISMAIDSVNIPYVVYTDEGNSHKIIVQKYDKDTNSWKIVGNIGFSEGYVQHMKIAIDSNNIPYVAYQESDNSSKLTVQKYNSSTKSWELVGNSGFSAGGVTHIEIDIDSNNIPYVVYKDYKNLTKNNSTKI